MKKYWCEYCGTTFHSKEMATMCRKLPACRGLGFPKQPVLSSWKVRGCAVILARTAGDMLQKSPAARESDRPKKMGEGIKKWADRAYKALEANTPISLGCATRVHRGLEKFVEERVWGNKAKIPNIYLLEVAARYVFDAKELVEEIIDSGSHRTFWFQDEHPEWLLYDAVSTPLAIYISQMKLRRQTNGVIDQALEAYGHPSRKKNPREVRPVEVDLLGEMLDHCWKDELRAWRYLEGAIKTAIKDIEKNGTPESLDLTKFSVDGAYEALMDYIWDESSREEKLKEARERQAKRLKCWLVDDRHWVLAESRRQATVQLVTDTGLVGREVVGVDPRKKLFDERGAFVETVEEMTRRLGKPMYVGRA